MNVDGCRIPYKANEEIQTVWKGASNKGDTDYGKYDKGDGFESGASEKGRFPANILISDDVLNNGEITKSKQSKRGDGIGIGYHGSDAEYDTIRGYDDAGSNSRYFDLDAWAQHNGFLQVPKASTSERDVGLEEFEYKKCGMMEDDNYPIKTGSGNLRDTQRRNIHPTVKPIKLMAYLVELGCPHKGIVLDPFVGSGTTCIAAKQLSRNYIGIELSPEYAEMARKRIDSFFENLDMVFE
jgi:site-specific DNA-methyltransferase (adenine-specific)